MPNAIILAYHGGGSDPFINFPGDSIRNAVLYNQNANPPGVYYPTGAVDRQSGILSRGSWLSEMNNRNNIPSTVLIDMTRSYNLNTREFTASIDFTALQNLSGLFRFNVILVEDGIVWAQNGSLGGPNYVHDWTVRSMMNGPLGEVVINGNWNQGQLISKTVNYTVPVPSGGGPDIMPDSCNVVVMVYQYGTPLSSNAAVQQAGQWTLISPDFVSTMVSQSPDLIASNSTLGQYETVVYNEGLLQDKYYFTLMLNAPVSWECDFTTPNGTFLVGEMDSIDVASGDSVTVTVNMNPNNHDGYGQATLEFQSANNTGVSDSTTFRFVTETGFKRLVIDATEGLHTHFLTVSLDKFIPGEYGRVSRSALHMANVMLNNFDIMFWSAGENIPAFYQEEVTALHNYLDNGGNLFITGQDIGNDIFGTGATSQHAQSFYNNYLHANFVNNNSTFFLVNGVTGDPISDGLQFVGTNIYPRSYDVIAPFDALASSIFIYYNGPNVAGIRADANNYRVVYLGMAFEQIGDEADRDSILVRSIRWFEKGAVGIEDDDLQLLTFELTQNYPNPFNPETVIKYSLDNLKAEQTTLTIYNALGQVVRRLVDKPQFAGNYDVTWDARDNFGNPVASGIYYYQLISAQNNAVQKMVLVR